MIMTTGGPKENKKMEKEENEMHAWERHEHELWVPS